MVSASLIPFTAGEASAVTGLTQVMQRDWRRRGFLKSVEGKAAFSAFDLADLKVMKLLADGGVGPATSRTWKRAVAYCVVSKALMSAEAYDASIPDTDSVRRAILRQHAGEESVYTGEHLPGNAHHMILQAPRFAVWWGEEHASVGSSLDDLHEARRGTAMATVPGLYLDMHGVAADLLREAGFLVHCEV